MAKSHKVPVPYRDQSETLAVGCWDGTLSHYSLSGESIGEESQLGFDPCCVSYMPNGVLCLCA